MLLLLLFLYVWLKLLQFGNAAADKIIFTIVPTTQYVWINQTATFTCATNLNNYSLSITVTNLAQSMIHQHRYDIEEGGEIVNTSFTATADLNDATIRCVADHEIGGVSTDVLNFSKPAYLYTQGPPSSAENLTAMQQDECSILIEWNAPHLLPGLSVSYNLDINDEEIYNISTTNYTYYPMKLTNTTYNVTVKAFNDSIIGESTNIDVLYETNETIQSINITYYHEMTKRQENIWITHYRTSLQTCNIMPSTMDMLNCYDGEFNVVSTGQPNITTDSNNGYCVTVGLALQQDKVYSVCGIITYNTGEQLMTNVVNISTYDIQNITITNTTNNKLCIQFDLVIGWIIEVAYAYLVDDHDEYKHSVNFMNATNRKPSMCFSDIPVGTWSLYICNEDLHDVCNRSIVPVLMINITSSDISPSSTFSTSPSFSSSNTSTSAKVSSYIYSPTPTGGDKPTIEIVGGVIGGLVLVIMIAIGVTAYYCACCMKCKGKARQDQRIPNDMEMTRL